LDLAKQNLGLTAEDLQSELLEEISAFVAGGTQSDDLTLMILARDLPG
jgi:serine phosphatase RsbU (regulator of sigma subunit)